MNRKNEHKSEKNLKRGKRLGEKKFEGDMKSEKIKSLKSMER